MLNYDQVYDELEKTQDLLTREIRKINEKNDLTPGELNSLKEAVCVMEKILKLDTMIEDAWNDDEDGEEDGYSERYDGRSYRRGRDVRTGRYVSRENRHYDDRRMNRGGNSMRGMSRHSLHDRMVANLESMMDNTGSDFERQQIGEWIDKIRSAPET